MLTHLISPSYHSSFLVRTRDSGQHPLNWVVFFSITKALGCVSIANLFGSLISHSYLNLDFSVRSWVQSEHRMYSSWIFAQDRARKLLQITIDIRQSLASGLDYLQLIYIVVASVCMPEYDCGSRYYYRCYTLYTTEEAEYVVEEAGTRFTLIDIRDIDLLYLIGHSQLWTRWLCIPLTQVLSQGLSLANPWLFEPNPLSVFSPSLAWSWCAPRRV